MSQSIRLPLHRTTEFRGFLYARSREEKGQFTLQLLPAAASERPGARILLDVGEGDWQKLAFHITLPGGSSVTREAARFSLANTGKTVLDVAAAELFPEDNAEGCDPEMVSHIRALGLPTLSCFGDRADRYRWRDGVGPREGRPSARAKSGDCAGFNQFGTDEFVRLCRNVGTDPLFCVGSDTEPEEAAAWVRYCNAEAEDTWGAQRVADDVNKPYGIRTWQILPDAEERSAARAAQRYRRFRDAMLEVDPQLKLIAPGMLPACCDRAGREQAARSNALLLQDSADASPAWLGLSPSRPLPGGPDRPDPGLLESLLAYPHFFDQVLLPETSRVVEAVLGPDSKTKLAVTDWGLEQAERRRRSVPSRATLAGAVYHALMFNAMLRNSDCVTLSTMNSITSGGVQRSASGVWLEPSFWTLLLYSKARPLVPLETVSVGPASDTPDRDDLPGMSDVPDVDVVAARDSSGGVVVFAVNRNSLKPRPLVLEINNVLVNSGQAQVLAALTPFAENSAARPDTVAPRPMAMPAGPPLPGADWRILLPPCSLTVIQFSV